MAQQNMIIQDPVHERKGPEVKKIRISIGHHTPTRPIWGRPMLVDVLDTYTASELQDFIHGDGVYRVRSGTTRDLLMKGEETLPSTEDGERIPVVGVYFGNASYEDPAWTHAADRIADISALARTGKPLIREEAPVRA